MVGNSNSRGFPPLQLPFLKIQEWVVVEEGATVTVAGLCGELGIFFFPFSSARKFEVAEWRAVKSLYGL